MPGEAISAATTESVMNSRGKSGGVIGFAGLDALISNSVGVFLRAISGPEGVV
jgi:hypothetical protein